MRAHAGACALEARHEGKVDAALLRRKSACYLESMHLRDSTDRELLAAVATLVGSGRELTAKLVACLAEVEDRRLHLQAGFSSMFEFCTRQLGMSEGEAFRRLLAARLGRRFPVVHSLLSTGAVHLSALELLREHLTDENHAELLDAASRKSKREVEALLARRFPRPDIPSRIRATRVEPLSERRFHVELTAGAMLVDKLELCRDLMRHSNPTGDIVLVVDRALDLLVADLRAKRLAVLKGSSRAQSPTHSRSKRVPRAVRRRVFERDGTRCTYVSPDGRRCEAQSFLELDHLGGRWAVIIEPRTSASSAVPTISSTPSSPSAARTSSANVTCASKSAHLVPRPGSKCSRR
jgi:hypothetical protein